jgi:hypothetical protein
MIKSTLESMIKKYYLANFMETSIWKVLNDKKQLRMAACTPNYVLSVVVELNNFEEIPTTEFAVNDTTKLLKMLNALDADIKLSVKQDNNGKIYNIVVNSGNIEMEYVTADINVLRANEVVKTIKKVNEPPFEVEIVLDRDFIDTYIASTTALSDSENVVFQMNKDNKLEMVFGHIQGANKSLNTSKIKYLPKTANGKDTLPSSLGFSSEYLKQILVANKDATDTILKLGVTKPMATAQFTSGDIIATYHVTGLTVK